MQRLILVLLVFVSFSSCKSVYNSQDFVQDDIYHSSHVVYRINRGTITFNENVAIPEGAVEYFDENYASSIRPQYSNRLRKFNESNNDTSYYDDTPPTQNEPNFANDKPWFSNVGFGLGVSAATFGGAYAGTYYNPYAPYTYYGVYVPTNSSSNRFTRRESQSTRPMAGYNSRNPSPSSVTRRPVAPVKSPARVYTNPNPGYNSESSTKYRTRTNTPSYTPPNFNNSSRNGGGYRPSGGAVRGAYRR